MKNKLIWLFLIILCSIPAISTLFHNGFFQSDDGEWMIIRFSAFHQALRDGQFPVRFLSRLNYGYGYPVANFLYPGFMYFGEIFKILGFGFVDTIKMVLGFSMVGSAIFTYLWLSKLFDKFSSFVGSLFYLYAPYHLFDLYKRGSVGEILSLAVAPFLLWQLERKSIFWCAIGIAFLILSHNTLSVLFLGLILAYMSLDIYISKNKKNLFGRYLFILIFGFGISSFFWLPAFFELQYTVFLKTQVSEWSRYFANIGLIGISTMFILILTFFFFLASKIQIQKHRLTILLFVTSLISIFFASSVSNFLWKFLPVSFVQFPFRFLSITILSVAFLSAVIVNQLKGNEKTILAIMLFTLLFFSAIPYIKPTVFFDKGDSYYATNEDTTTVKNEYMPTWVKNNTTDHYRNKVEIVNGTISNLQIRSNKINFEATSVEGTNVIVNTIYFPGWKVFVDSSRSDFSYINSNGVIMFDLLAGKHSVEVSFFETPVRLISDIISVASLLVLLIILTVRSRRLIA